MAEMNLLQRLDELADLMNDPRDKATIDEAIMELKLRKKAKKQTGIKNEKME